MGSTKQIMFVLGLAAIGAVPASAAIINPTTEDFASSNANWKVGLTPFPDADFVSTDGPSGANDGFIRYVRDVGTAGATATITLLRGQDNFNSSGDAFVGNWLSAGVNKLSFWVRHNGPVPMTMGARFAGIANFPAYAGETGLIPSNTWTKVEFDIVQGNPSLTYEGAEGPTSFSEIFGNLANIQVFTKRGSVPENTIVSFDVDKVTAVPEPGMIAPAGAAMVGLLVRRRRSRRA